MNRYLLTQDAINDLDSIWHYLRTIQGSPEAAFRQLESLHDRFKLLASSNLVGEERNDLSPGVRIFPWGNM